MLELLFLICFVLLVTFAVFVNSIYLIIKETKNQMARKLFGICMGIPLVVTIAASEYEEPIYVAGYMLDGIAIFMMMFIAYLTHGLLLKGWLSVIAFLSPIAFLLPMESSLEVYCGIMLTVMCCYHLRRKIKAP